MLRQEAGAEAESEVVVSEAAGSEAAGAGVEAERAMLPLICAVVQVLLFFVPQVLVLAA